MSFDEEVDEVKREMQTAKLDPAARRATTQKLCQKLKDAIASRRVDFSIGEQNGEPVVSIKHREQNEVLASVFVNEDGSITFQSASASEDDRDDEEDSGYFPNYVEYYDEDEFLEDARDILKVGIAEYELDRESGPRS